MENNINLPENQRWCIGYEGRYAVTCDGEVYSYVEGSIKFSQKMNFRNRYCDKRCEVTYPMVGLVQIDGVGKKQVMEYIHRLVAKAWVPNPDDKPQVNHIDHDKTNNHYSNLEWVSNSENVNASYKFRGGTFLSKIMQNRGFSENSDFINLLKSGDSRGYKSFYSILNKIPEEVFLEVGVPRDIRSTVLRSYCILDNWNFIITYLDAIFVHNLSLAELSDKFYLSYTLPSHIKSGRRWEKEVELYNKYRNDPNYNKNYEPVYDLR
jgi:hypothetical protein